MKTYKLSALLMVLFLAGFSATAFAQFDDVYYDPSNDTEDYYETSYDDYEEDTTDDNFDASNYDDDSYDYYYSSRIRRFSRPYAGFGFYSPAYVDQYYYGAYGNPGAAIYSLNYYGSRATSYTLLNRNSGLTLITDRITGQRYYTYNNYGYDPYNPYNTRFNRYGGIAFGRQRYGGGGGGGYGSAGYCPPSWNTGSYNAVRPTSGGNNNAQGNYYGSGNNSNVKTGGRDAGVNPRGGATKGRRNSSATGGTTSPRNTRATQSSSRTRSSSTAPSRATKQRSSIFNRSSPTRSTTTPSRSSRSNSSYTPSKSSSSRSSSTRSSSPSRSSSKSKSTSRSSSRRGN